MEIPVITSPNKELTESARNSFLLKQIADKEIVIDFRQVTNFAEKDKKQLEEALSSIERKASKTMLVKLIEALNEALVYNGTRVEFKIYEKTKTLIVKIIDKETQRVLKEMPSEKILDMVTRFLEQSGLIVDEVK